MAPGDIVAKLGSAAAASDGVIHTAFKHDIAFSGGFAEVPNQTAWQSRRSAQPWPVLTGHYFAARTP